MQRSFSIVDDDDEENIEEFLKKSNAEFYSNKSDRDSDSDGSNPSPKISPRELCAIGEPSSSKAPEPLPRHGSHKDKIPSPTSTNERLRSPQIQKLAQLSSDSEDDSENDKQKSFPGEYDPKEYENLDVDSETKEIFQYITKYIPQKLDLDYKFKPFIPEFLPAVGDIDAFLKVMAPELDLNGEPFKSDQLKLGLEVLDEPAANQSDPALLHLQLRASSVKANDKNINVIVKKIDNVEKNAKTIDKWIKDISDLHKSKSSPVVRYSEQMPDLDDLMQEWPEEMEAHLQKNGFPKPESDGSLSDYVTTVCEVFSIPANKNKIQSLHLLFSLFAAIKSSQLYEAAKSDIKLKTATKKEADQLVLE